MDEQPKTKEERTQLHRERITMAALAKAHHVLDHAREYLSLLRTEKPVEVNDTDDAGNSIKRLAYPVTDLQMADAQLAVDLAEEDVEIADAGHELAKLGVKE